MIHGLLKAASRRRGGGGSGDSDPYFSNVLFVANFESGFADAKGHANALIGSPTVSGGGVNLASGQGVKYGTTLDWALPATFCLEVEFSQSANYAMNFVMGRACEVKNGREWAIYTQNGVTLSLYMGLRQSNSFYASWTLPAPIQAAQFNNLRINRASGGVCRAWWNGVQVGGTQDLNVLVYNGTLPGMELVLGKFGTYPDDSVDLRGVIRKARITTDVTREITPTYTVPQHFPES